MAAILEILVVLLGVGDRGIKEKVREVEEVREVVNNSKRKPQRYLNDELRLWMFMSLWLCDG
jgi:Mg2+/Co2+ transporter CorB